MGWGVGSFYNGFLFKFKSLDVVVVLDYVDFETHLSTKRATTTIATPDSGRKRLLSMGTLSSGVFSIVRKQRQR